MVADAAACLYMLRAEQPDLELVRASLTAVVKEGARAGDVLARIRALLTRSAVGHQPCAIDDVIQCAVSLARVELARQGIQLELALRAEDVSVMGDVVELQQVLLNLMLNAGEAARGLNSERHRVLVRSVVDRSQAETHVVVSIRDFGIGLDEHTSEQLFSAFYTTKPGGLGMGLSISRSIIERHGGRIWASQNVDRGATFAFSLNVLSV
jgi:C4-dicarboxylate-specific signal transduction histidine kinase